MFQPSLWWCRISQASTVYRMLIYHRVRCTVHPLQKPAGTPCYPGAHRQCADEARPHAGGWPCGDMWRPRRGWEILCKCGQNNNEPPIWGWFIAPISGDLGDGLLLNHIKWEHMENRMQLREFSSLSKALAKRNGVFWPAMITRGYPQHALAHKKRSSLPKRWFG